MDQKSRRDGSSGKKERRKLKKLFKKEGFGEPRKGDDIPSVNENSPEILKENQPKQVNKEKQRRKSTTKKKRRREKGTEVENFGCENEDPVNDINYMSKKSGKQKKTDHVVATKERKKVEKETDVEEDEVYFISSGDEDDSRGMKKWISEYHKSRPDLKILQQRIDDFITAHEEQEEQARKEKEARIAEEGWTIVKHHKGRKKTTDSESRVTVGSVAEAAVLDKLANKKKKGVALDFYNFQRRESQRNEVMMLQSKFEQDKKRIQQLRTARKFRPY